MDDRVNSAVDRGSRARVIGDRLSTAGAGVVCEINETRDDV